MGIKKEGQLSIDLKLTFLNYILQEQSESTHILNNIRLYATDSGLVVNYISDLRENHQYKYKSSI